MALASPSTTLASNTQPLVPASAAAVVPSRGFIHNALSPVPLSGFDLCMLGALAASSTVHAVGVLGEARHGAEDVDVDDDDDQENQSARLQNETPPDGEQQSRDLPVLRTAQPPPEQSPLWSGSRLMELSKKDLNLLKLSSEKLYSFPTQVPPLNSLLYMDKPASQ